MLTGTLSYPQPDEVIYGRPVLEALTDFAGNHGLRRIALVTTRSLRSGLATTVAHALGPVCAGIIDRVGAHSPRCDVFAGAERAREMKADLLVAIGGGSVIDATKLMQLCLWANIERETDLDKYRANAIDGAPPIDVIRRHPRMVAVPTTLSAAEFTASAGVTRLAGDKSVKESYSRPELIARAVILDPRVTLDTPGVLWFSTGMKAVDHAVEQLSGLVRVPFADTLCAEGLSLLAAGLRAVRQRFDDLEGRQHCQLGMWLAMTGVVAGRGMGPSHALGRTLGAGHGVAHGITSCVTLPAVLRWNERFAAREQQRVAVLLGEPQASAADAVDSLIRDLGLPTSLAAVGIGRHSFRTIAAHTMKDRRILNSPRRISGVNDIVEILDLAADERKVNDDA